MAVNGNNIIIYTYSGSAWVAVAGTKSDELQSECELIEKASSTQQEWKEYIAGRKGWSLNVNWLVSAVSDIQKVLQIGTRVKIHVGSRGYTGGASGVTGFAFVKNCKVNMTRGNLANGSFSFTGDGELAIPSS